ncbi:hypothetical protein [Polaromonas sp.]|uniref:hypothetical protein n=1 Tax=Polaromonas sp. TaxID=1869339 RepID=UPI00356576F3
MPSKASQLNPFWSLSAIFVVAVGLNYVWELAQAFLYVWTDDKKGIWWHCFVASLGDGLLLWVIFLIGWLVFRRSDWFVRPNRRQYAVMLTIGLTIGIAVEWVAVNLLGRWSYTEDMPLLGGSGIGVVPMLQMLILPPVIFAIVAKLGAMRTAGTSYCSGPVKS